MRGRTRRRKMRPNYRRIVLAIIVLLLIIIAGIFGIKNIIKNNELTELGEVEENNSQEEIAEDITINFVAIGDIMCHSTNFKAAYNDETGEYDFSSVFVNVAKYITKADIAIGNLETTFAGEDRGYSGYPTFNSPAELRSRNKRYWYRCIVNCK